MIIKQKRVKLNKMKIKVNKKMKNLIPSKEKNWLNNTIDARIISVAVRTEV